MSYGLAYESSNGERLTGYSDSSHNSYVDDGRSTSGHIFYLERCPITWCSSKQEIVAISSCEAEFMAATEAEKQAIVARSLVLRLQHSENPQS